MAFNILAENNSPINWSNVYSKVIASEPVSFDIIPIVEDDYNAIGISIHKSDLSVITFNRLKQVIKELKGLGFSVFELYKGTEITNKNIDTVLKEYISPQ